MAGAFFVKSIREAKLMGMLDIIAKKRDGHCVTYKEMEYFISGYIDGKIPDYQAAAFLMASYIKCLDMSETLNMTKLMARSGKGLNLEGIKGFWVDKHSTGGVGDKTTLVLAPLVASCGIPFVKMSGRGLGHTGGTIDKLESIPGFRTQLDPEEINENVKRTGISIIAQTEKLAPADKKIYSLRDATATVDSIPLIASSIMSKKIAYGADKLLLDVKNGTGAFMKSFEESLQLAGMMVDIGCDSGMQTAAYITDMNSPLGNSIGNTLEVIEAVETMKGNGPRDFKTLVLEMSSRILEMAHYGTMDECREKTREALANGKALEKFAQMVKAQGGNPEFIDNYKLLGEAEKRHDIFSVNDGYVKGVKAELIGRASLLTGAGRETKESSIDHTAGIVLNKKPRMKVHKGDLLASIYTNRSKGLSEASELVKESFMFSAGEPDLCPLILAYVDSQNIRRYADREN